MNIKKGQNINQKVKEKRKAVFLDRDGVINDLVYRGEDFFVAGKKITHTAPHFLHELKFKNGVVESIEKIRKLGFMCILVTNQPDAKYGFMPITEYQNIMSEVSELPLDDIYVCMHGREDNCECKKPKAGMLLDAVEKWGIDPSMSFMVGDKDTDILAGKTAGCITVLVAEDPSDLVKYHHHIQHLSELPSILEEYSF